MFGLQSGLPVQGAKWDELREKDFEGRLDAINDETFCKALVSELARTKILSHSSPKGILWASVNLLIITLHRILLSYLNQHRNTGPRPSYVFQGKVRVVVYLIGACLVQT